MNKTTLIIGASHKPDRYANKAQKALTEAGHEVIPFNPRGGEIEGVEVRSDLSNVTEDVDTVTLYVRPSVLEDMVPTLIDLNPRRVIFNPGTEHEGLELKFVEAGIKVSEACTLVMLNTGEY
ncbi:CoA-binding protein [Oceaniferula spumae]|uniref:CoA-binding protein n=1 Tax=Oceaniferula spumae TaxID=2979115 RepID=A0AAT9FNH4_9BACT